MVFKNDSRYTGVYKFLNNPIKETHETVQDDSENVSCISEDLSQYINEKAIIEMVKVNTEITKIFNKLKIPVKINMGILDNLVNHHMRETREIALGIAKHMMPALKQFINYKALAQATSLHDLAKVIIPENILNKKGKLTEEEYEIMKKHSDLSYEMLKSTDLDSQTLNLIKNHHRNTQRNYEQTSDDFTSEINLQILSIADVYSALREKRCYKPAMSKDEALEILEKDVQKGKFSIHVYNALCDYINKELEPDVDNKGKVVHLKSVNSLRA